MRDKQFGSLLARIYIYQMPLELRLSVDKTQFEADGNDSVKMTVESGWSTITEGVEFYNDQDELIEIEDFRFKTTTVGSYSIYAKYEGLSPILFIFWPKMRIPLSILLFMGKQDLITLNVPYWA